MSEWKIERHGGHRSLRLAPRVVTLPSQEAYRSVTKPPARGRVFNPGSLARLRIDGSADSRRRTPIPGPLGLPVGLVNVNGPLWSQTIGVVRFAELFRLGADQLVGIAQGLEDRIFYLVAAVLGQAHQGLETDRGIGVFP